MDHEGDIPVLIVGAGPAGLTAAVTLARYGVRCMLVERRPDLSSLPRATSVSTRTMELLRSWGLEEEVLAGGVDADWQVWDCETLSRAAEGQARTGGFPSPAQSAMVSPAAPACVPQDWLEPVLLSHLRALGTAQVEFGAEIVDAASGPDGVRAVLRRVAKGERRVVRARYLIAADGAHSGVRKALGIRMSGPSDLEDAITALFSAPLTQLLGDRLHGIYNITHPDAPGLFLPAGRGDRWLYGHLLDRERDRIADFTEDVLTRRIRIGAGVWDLRPRIERIGGFTFAAQVAESYRRDSAFLVGDAAHRVTPRGGTGMNTAIHDGHDLGWKLSWVLRGWADAGLLDSYEAERRPVAEHNAEWSADPNASARPIEDTLAVDIGGRIPHVWLASGGGRVSTLDLLGPGLTLFAGPRWAAATSVSARAPVTVRRLDAISARAMGVSADGALVARPDGRPAEVLTAGAPALRRVA
ncbi:MAG TPA: FAD-dependent monooxygenase [Thermoleophilaceae bacterium]|jgi:2-polyprenyl-6-methoxyphenol hydroxylase-like FAD-dependent oxidoreductase